MAETKIDETCPACPAKFGTVRQRASHFRQHPAHAPAGYQRVRTTARTKKPDTRPAPRPPAPPMTDHPTVAIYYRRRFHAEPDDLIAVGTPGQPLDGLVRVVHNDTPFGPLVIELGDDLSPRTRDYLLSNV